MANTSGSGRTQTDKDRSKQMSRSVAKNPPGKTGGRPGQGSGGPRRNAPRAGSGGPPNRGSGGGKRTGGARPSPSRPSRRSPTALLTWGTAALVVVIVIVLVVVKISGGGTHATSGPPWVQTPATIAAQVTGVPASVYDAVGINSPVTEVNPPISITGQKPLTFTSANGTSLPGVYFYGAEYCPYCAAGRWAIITALSRFGTFHNLGDMQSSSTDVYANTQTFTFSKATYTSPYFVFKPDEYLSNQVDAAGNWTVLQKPTPAELALVEKYDSSTYFPDTLSEGESGFPFIDFGNKILEDFIFSPAILASLSRSEIASGLTDPKNPITQAIIASANYLSASVCSIDGQQPASVCTSSGVTAAAKAMKLS